MKILINYADNGFKEAQKINSTSGLKFGFDRVINYSRADIDSEFLKQNEQILSIKQGAGVYLWKPYTILKTLLRDDVNDGDIVWYNDSGAEFIHNINPLLDELKDENIILFTNNYKNSQYIKRDAFVYMKCDTEKHHNNLHLQASTQIYRKCDESVKFVTELLKYSADERIITDNENVSSKPNLPDFVAHRWDQSVLSLMYSKSKLKIHRDPTQWGELFKNQFNDKYPKIINHTRLSK